jgi:SAM-dependent methyltransferase
LVERMLRDIAMSNRLFGGRHAVRWGLARLFDPSDAGGQFTLLDVGTGAGDLPLDATRWAARRGLTLRGAGLERTRAAAHLARSAGLPVVIGCASTLPVRERSVDVILVSQLAHHLDDTDVVALFRACSVAARRGVIVADLRPSTLAARAYRIGSRLLGMHRMTRVDGVTSIARGFTSERMRALVSQAGHPGAAIAALPFARITAAWRT